jgi:hypothetical protein
MGVAGNEEGVHADVDGRLVVLVLVALLLLVVVVVVVLGVCGCAAGGGMRAGHEHCVVLGNHAPTAAWLTTTAVVQRRSLHGLLYKG